VRLAWDSLAILSDRYLGRTPATAAVDSVFAFRRAGSAGDSRCLYRRCRCRAVINGIAVCCSNECGVEHMLRMIVILWLAEAVCPIAQAQLKIQAVVNAASFQSEMPRGGALASIFVSGLKGTPGITVAPSLSELPPQLAGVTVIVNGATAPILAVVIPPKGQNGQINIQVPQERNATLQPDGSDKGGTLQVSQDSESDTLTPLAARNWGGFLMEASGYAIAQHASDYRPVTVQNPAHPGETLIAYADDFFTVWPPPPIGFAAPLHPSFQISGTPPTNYGLYLQEYPTPIIPICGGCVPSGSFTDTPSLEILFQGLAPTLVGIEQINFVVPIHQQPGDWALFFNLGSCTDGSGYKCASADGFGSSSPYVKLPVR